MITPVGNQLPVVNADAMPLAKSEMSVVKTKSKLIPEWRLDITAGAGSVSKTISGFNPNVTEKRNAEEKNVFAPQLNISFSQVTDKFALSAGVSYQQYGEKVDYDPEVKNKILIENGHWNTFYTTVIDTDTNFVYGYVYYTQVPGQELDSTYIPHQDSVEFSTINNNLKKAKGNNVISYVEIPLTASYYFGKGKFRYGVMAGVSAGMLVYSKGYYLNAEGNDVYDINERKTFRKMIYNGQAGLDLQYCLSPALHFVLRPQYRFNLNSIVKDESGGKQKYSSVGITAGVSFLLK
jgi:hypothetical protein